MYLSLTNSYLCIINIAISWNTDRPDQECMATFVHQLGNSKGLAEDVA